MIDVGGNFDPRKLLHKPAMQTDMSMGSSAMNMPRAPQMGGGSPMQGPAMNRSNVVQPPPIPNVASHQPLGNGIMPSVTGTTSSLPAGNLPSTGSSILETPQADMRPNSNPLRAQLDTWLQSNPGDQGRMAQAFGISQGEVDSAMGGRSSTPSYTNPSTPPNTSTPSNTSSGGGNFDRSRWGSVGESSWGTPGQTYRPPDDVRLGYGFNPGQWGINRNIESIADRNEASGGGYVPGFSREQWLKSQPGYYGGTDPRNPAGFVPGLPDEAEYNAYREASSAPFYASVAREAAQGRMPGSSDQPQQIPNYTAPITNLEGTYPQQQAPVPQAQAQLPGRDPRWTGTQTRRPSYF